MHVVYRSKGTRDYGSPIRWSISRGKPETTQADYACSSAGQAMCLEEMLLLRYPGRSLVLPGDPSEGGRGVHKRTASVGAKLPGRNAPAVSKGIHPQSEAVEILQRLFPEGTVSAEADADLSRSGLSRAVCYGGISMKHLLNTLFVTSEDIYLSLDGENVVANREKT